MDKCRNKQMNKWVNKGTKIILVSNFTLQKKSKKIIRLLVQMCRTKGKVSERRNGFLKISIMVKPLSHSVFTWLCSVSLFLKWRWADVCAAGTPWYSLWHLVQQKGGKKTLKKTFYLIESLLRRLCHKSRTKALSYFGGECDSAYALREMTRTLSGTIIYKITRRRCLISSVKFKYSMSPQHCFFLSNSYFNSRYEILTTLSL